MTTNATQTMTALATALTEPKQVAPQTMSEKMDKPGTGAPERVWILEFLFTAIAKSDNTLVKPDVDQIWRNSELGIAYQNFLRALHKENAKVFHKGNEEAPVSGRVLTIERVFDEGPKIKRLTQGMHNVP